MTAAGIARSRFKEIGIRLLIGLFVVLLVAIGAACWMMRPDVAQHSVAAVSGDNPVITAPLAQTIPTMNVAEAVGWPSGGAPVAAAGLTVSAFARHLAHPR